jgi:hypothetical protein
VTTIVVTTARVATIHSLARSPLILVLQLHTYPPHIHPHPSDMRIASLVSLLPLLAAHTAYAAPSFHIPSANEIASKAFDSASSWVQNAFTGLNEKAQEVAYDLDQLKTATVNVKGIECA